MHVCGIQGTLPFGDIVQAHVDVARRRLAGGDTPERPALPEGQWPEIQAWRRVYAEMGLQPTQVRCAAEALLRRLRQSGQFPQVNPLVDLCNSVSVRAAVPIAVFDCGKIDWPLTVARANGDEVFLNFAGEVEHPATAEVIFVDGARRAHARRWAHRQSGRSAVRPGTESVLIVVEAFHEGAPATIAAALGWLEEAFMRQPGCVVTRRVLNASSPEFVSV